jgi:NAD(P)-dependent dehydrogenase (short-subunit alcohol dehydrogenase family)
VGDNKLGGWHSYRASKTALNQLTVNCAIEFDSKRKKHPITFLLLHPGTVDTDLSTPFKKNVPAEKLFTTDESRRAVVTNRGRQDARRHRQVLRLGRRGSAVVM